MESTLKVKNLIPGVYVINAYALIQTSFGNTYKIYATNATNEKFVFWSNSFLSSHINKIRPRHEIETVIDFNGRITITGYSPVTKLTPKIIT